LVDLVNLSDVYGCVPVFDIYRIPVFYVQSDYRIENYCIGQNIDHFCEENLMLEQ